MACLTDNRTGCNGLGSSAYGYWGRSVYKRLAEEQEFNRQRALLQDQIAGTGIRTALWIGVKSGEKCSCYKESNQQADRMCRSCYGVIDGYVPGYNKFGYETLWMNGVDTDVTLTDVEITNTFKSSKVQLTSSATTGTIESSDKAFTRSAIGSTWEYEVSSFVRIENLSSVTVEYSLDSGSTWVAISELITANPSSGVIRFRATLSRDTADVLSPLFEIIRARYATISLSGQRSDGTYDFGPHIRIMHSKPYKSYKKSEYGDRPAIDSMNFWISGLGMFNPSIAIGSPEELLNGPDVLIEILDGALAGKRYMLINWMHSDPSATLVTQSFTLRVIDPSEPKSLIW